MNYIRITSAKLNPPGELAVESGELTGLSGELAVTPNLVWQ
jgi:hypothetical protein